MRGRARVAPKRWKKGGIKGEGEGRREGGRRGRGAERGNRRRKEFDWPSAFLELKQFPFRGQGAGAATLRDAIDHVKSFVSPIASPVSSVP